MEKSDAASVGRNVPIKYTDSGDRGASSSRDSQPIPGGGAPGVAVGGEIESHPIDGGRALVGEALVELALGLRGFALAAVTSVVTITLVE